MKYRTLIFLADFNIYAVKLFCYLIPLTKLQINLNNNTSLTSNDKKERKERACT